MKNETKTICVAEAEKLVPKVRENCRRAGAPEPPGGITEWFVLVLAVDLYQAVLAGRVIPIPADVYYRTARILNTAAEEQQAGGVEKHRAAPRAALAGESAGIPQRFLRP